MPVTDEPRRALGTTPRLAPRLVLSEVIGAPYKADNFRAVLGDVRQDAGLQFRDLSRTAVVTLAEAGCTVPEIASITGRSIDRTEKLFEVYLARNTQKAQRHREARGSPEAESWRLRP